MRDHFFAAGDHFFRPAGRQKPVVVFHAWRVTIRDEGVVRRKAVYLALAVAADGWRDILGLSIEQTEGAKVWVKAFTDRTTCQIVRAVFGMSCAGSRFVAVV